MAGLLAHPPAHAAMKMPNRPIRTGREIRFATGIWLLGLCSASRFKIGGARMRLRLSLPPTRTVLKVQV